MQLSQTLLGVMETQPPLLRIVLVHTPDVPSYDRGFEPAPSAGAIPGPAGEDSPAGERRDAAGAAPASVVADALGDVFDAMSQQRRRLQSKGAWSGALRRSHAKALHMGKCRTAQATQRKTKRVIAKFDKRRNFLIIV